jgi:hypothetical protein
MLDEHAMASHAVKSVRNPASVATWQCAESVILQVVTEGASNGMEFRIYKTSFALRHLVQHDGSAQIQCTNGELEVCCCRGRHESDTHARSEGVFSTELAGLTSCIAAHSLQGNGHEGGRSYQAEQEAYNGSEVLRCWSVPV